MKDCDCYSFKLINQTDDPILKNVDLAIVLTMENSSRKFDDTVLLNLAPLTYVQINKGFKKCNKPGVTNSTEDVKHAFKNVCKNTTSYNNVIIFEDDAIFNYKYSIDEFKNIDDFISKEKFDIYSLGSVSFDIPTLSNHKLMITPVGACHAVIYSKSARSNLIYINGYNFDNDIISSLQHKYKYKYPLICQTFPNTPAKSEWANTSKNFLLSRYMDFTGAEYNIEPFWSSIYVICDWCIYCVILIIILVIIKSFN